MTVRGRLVWVALVVLAAGCGSDFRPPDLPTTGEPAGPLGQVLDLDIDFPELRVMGQDTAGVAFEMRVELERAGFGEIPARLSYGEARLATDVVPVEDLTDGRAVVTVTPERWVTGRIGPLRISGTAFEMILDGERSPDERISGRVLGSLGLDEGTFRGWRRRRFLVTTTDFLSTSGRVEEVVLVRENELRVRRRLELVSSDPLLRVTGDGVFAINRLSFDNLQRLDPRTDFATTWQATMGSGANPQDALLVAEGRGYVTRYEPPFDDVAIFDADSGVVVDRIPLGELAENPDGTPRPTAMRRSEGAVFVALQDIDRSFTVFGEGKLAVIDPNTDTVVGVIPLGGQNPFAIDVVRGADGRERLYVALAGIYPGLGEQRLTGGVVVVDPLNRVVERVALDDDTAGGNVGGLAVLRDSLGYVVVSDESFVNRVLAFDPGRGTVLRTVLETDEYVPEIATDSTGLLAIPDRRFFAPQTCLYRTPVETGQAESLIHCAPLDLPPFSIEALD